MSLTPNFNKALTDVTPEEVQALIEGKLNAANPLYSEDLTRANYYIRQTKNEALIEAFTETASILMQNQYASGGGHGFGLRQSAGIGVNDMLRNGDTGVLDRNIAWAARDCDDPVMLSSLKTLRAELKAYCAEKGMTIHATHHGQKVPVGKPAA